MQYSVHSPNPYIYAHQAQLLPDWDRPVASVLVVLQRCSVALGDRTIETEACKHYFRQQFIELGNRISQSLGQIQQLSAPFDPQTGLPLSALTVDVRSGFAHRRLDDVAVVRSLLGYEGLEVGGCVVILHPAWGNAVYPSVLLSSATPQTLELAVVAALKPRLTPAILSS